MRSSRLGSPQAVYSTFLHSASSLYLADDFGDQLQFARRQPSGLLGAALSAIAGRLAHGDDILLDSWAELGFIKRPDDSLPARPHLRSPALTMLAVIGGDQVGKALSRAELSRGALDSMLFLPALDEADWHSRPAPRRSPVPDSVCDLLRQLRGTHASEEKPSAETLRALAMNIPGSAVITFAADPADAERAMLERFSGAGLAARALAEGARHNLRRAACVLAAAANPAAPVVTQNCLTWAAGFVGNCLQAIVDEYSLHGGDEKPDTYQVLLEIITRAGPLGITSRDLARQCRAFRAMDGDRRATLLGQMLADEVIVDQKEGQKTTYVSERFATVEYGPRANSAPAVTSCHQLSPGGR